MARRNTAPKENHERWLVSYADLVTLLFAFFVVMFASTQTDHSRAKQISEGVLNALTAGSTPPKVSAILGGTVDDKGRGDTLLQGSASARLTAGKEAEPVTDLHSTADLLRQR